MHPGCVPVMFGDIRAGPSFLQTVGSKVHVLQFSGHFAFVAVAFESLPSLWHDDFNLRASQCAERSRPAVMES